MLPVALLALLASPALADDQPIYASDVVELDFHDYFNAFEAIDFDTGHLPDGSPLAVRFFIKSYGGSYAEFTSESFLTWPQALTQQIIGVPGTGLLDLDSRIEIAAQVTFDIWSFRGAYDVWSEDIRLIDQRAFDPDLLPDSIPASVEMVADGDGLVRPYSTTIPLFAGLSLKFEVQVFPRATSSLSGRRYETGEQHATQTAQEILHDVPRSPERIRLLTSYIADVGASLSVIIQPSLELCAPIFGCFRVARFDMPVPLVNDTIEHEFGPIFYDHPLPALEPPVASHDFGDVPVETLANLQLPLKNIGLLPLEGWLEIEGDGSFSVFPPYFYATEGNTSGAVVTFDPQQPGLQTAELVVVSNDPREPELRIPIYGVGWVEPVEDPDIEAPRLSGAVGCGCASASSPGSASLLGLGLGLLLLLRRRR